jgi:tetratricopeptide (TPR) repeat protein
MPQAQLQTLLAQKKYRQAIDEIKKLQRSQPTVEISPSEALVWILRGKQELEKEEFKAAENSFRQAMKLGLVGEVHYWIAKALLCQNRIDPALEFIRNAFEAQSLPKDYAICYLKLLLIKGDRDTVESLITTQSKRFSAAQLHWAKGVLALQSGDLDKALPAFTKIKKPLTPGDSPDAWLTYTYQQQKRWPLSAEKLGLSSPATSWNSRVPSFDKHPALRKLAIYHQAILSDPQRALVPREDRATQEIFTALSAIHLISEGNVHDAGHAILKLSPSSSRVAELMTLRSKILALAGQQALQQTELGCVMTLWQPLLQGKNFDPQLAVNFLGVLEHEGEYQEKQRLLTRLIKSIEEEAKRDRTAWSDDRRNLTLAHAHCLIADCWMAMERSRAAVGSVQQAARICPTSPEVIGRQGLVLATEEKLDLAIEKLTLALEKGCKSPEVYAMAQEILLDQGQKSAALDLRKRYGKNFGDFNAESEVEMADWIELLSSRNLEFLRTSIPDGVSTDPPLRVLQIFCSVAHGKLTGTGKTSIEQDRAIKSWDKLLAPLAPADQVTTLQAIVLSIELLAKRDKGIAALSTRYMLKLAELKSEVPEATVAHLILLAVREKTSAKLQVPLTLYLNSQPNPNNALAQLQLQVRWFSLGFPLRSFLDKALLQEPQNPLLLLAKATTYDPESQIYQTLREQGFELARQLQDAQALQAFRVEDHYLQTQEFQQVIPNPGQLENMTPRDFDQFFENMIRQTLGKKVPKAELERMIPILKQQFMEEVIGDVPPGFGGNPFGGGIFGGMFDDNDDEDLFFGRSKKRKKSNPFF